MRIEQMLGMLMGRVAQGLRGADPVSKFYLESIERLVSHALGPWTAVSMAGLRCSHELEGRGRGCPLPPAGSCVGCDKLVCLAHALITPQTPVLLCASCATRAVPKLKATWEGARHKGPRSAEPAADEIGATRTRHLTTLGLGEDASLEEIREAQRRLARRYHPDRHRDPKKRASAERQMKAINEAAAWLIEHEEAA